MGSGIGIDLLELAHEQANPPLTSLSHGKRLHRVSQGLVVERAAASIDAIVIHQTACVFGPLSDPIKRHHRALGVACHALAFRDGVVAFPNPLTWYVYHANELNARSLGIEIEGHFPGSSGDPRTPQREDGGSMLGGQASVLTPELVEASCVAIEQLVARAGALGAQIRYLFAHRQSSSSRRADPGWEIWQRVVLDYGVRVLGLETLPALRVGTGRPIPLQWDRDRGIGEY